MIKSVFFFMFGLLLAFHLSTNAQENSKKMFPLEIENLNNSFFYDRFYLSAQPNLSELKWYKSKNVSKIINLRSENENLDFANEAFDEKEIVTHLGMEYVSIPVAGRSGYTVENLSAFINEIENNSDTLLIHCAGAGRVTYFMMAYLIKSKGWSTIEAEKFGEHITYTNYLKLLLEDTP